MKNDDLKVIVKELSTALGIDIPADLEDMSNKNLVVLVSDLKAKTKDASLSTAADAPKDEKPTAKADAPKVEKPFTAKQRKIAKAKQTQGGFTYKVAKNKSITCKKGTINELEPIEVEWLGGGKAAMDSLVERKCVLKKG